MNSFQELVTGERRELNWLDALGSAAKLENQIWLHQRNKEINRL